MSEFFFIERAREGVIGDLDRLILEAAEANDEETTAATVLQRHWRGTQSRSLGRRKQASCLFIQRCFRGWRSRRRVAALKEEKEAARRELVFHYYALQIQRAFRGFYSRKYEHDFYFRKEVVQRAKRKGEELRAKLEEDLRAQMEAARRAKEERDQAEFKRLTQGLHHLVSTKATPGIYNSPFLLDQPITAFGRPVEDHIRASVSDLLKSQGITASKRFPPRPRNKRSVQASSKFGADKEAELREARHARRMQMTDAPFVAGARVKTPRHEHGAGVGTEYLEQWRIQMTTRQINDRDLSKRVAPEPFYTTGQRNQVFDEKDGYGTKPSATAATTSLFGRTAERARPDQTMRQRIAEHQQAVAGR